MDGDYLYAFQRVIMPIALEFNPDFVIGKHLRGFIGL
jgi:histone deacetylase 6